MRLQSLCEHGGLPARKEFSDGTVDIRWKIAEGQCECELGSCGHGGTDGRCGARLTKGGRGTEWEADHHDGRDDNSLANCRILCVECHRAKTEETVWGKAGGSAFTQ